MTTPPELCAAWAIASASSMTDAAGPKNADVDLEAPVEHVLLAVDDLDRHIVRRVVARKLVDFAGFNPGIDERAEPNPSQISRPASRNGSIKARKLPLGQADGFGQAVSQEC